MIPELNKIYQGDCLEIMRQWPDKCVDLVLTDPPYGIGEAAGKNKSRGKLAVAKDFGNDSWDNAPPSPEYFAEILRISKNAVIFGGNYFAEWLGNSSCWIFWDKNNGDSDFADGELAWTNFSSAVRRIHYRWAGMLQENMKDKEVRVHPTQKPVAVMGWIIDRYSQPGSVIVDPFMGSGTTIVAAERAKRSWIGIEREQKYFSIAQSRIDAERAQGKLF